MGAPMVVDIGGVSHGVSELLQAVYTRPLGRAYICYGFCRSFEVKFWFPQFGGTRAL